MSRNLSEPNILVSIVGRRFQAHTLPFAHVDTLSLSELSRIVEKELKFRVATIDRARTSAQFMSSARASDPVMQEICSYLEHWRTELLKNMGACCTAEFTPVISQVVVPCKKNSPPQVMVSSSSYRTYRAFLMKLDKICKAGYMHVGKDVMCLG